MKTNEWYYYQILRFCLSREDISGEDISETLSKLDWKDLFIFATRQSIVGIIAPVVLATDKRIDVKHFKNNKPHSQDIATWMIRANAIAEKNRITNRYCAQATKNFKSLGFRSCILKGQGNNLFYPNPYTRSSGDIDIWVDASRWEIMCYVRKIFPKTKFRLHHIEFPVWKEMPVEVHFCPAHPIKFWDNRKYKQFFKQYREEQFNNQKQLPDNAGQICIPTPFFNSVYQLTHINSHLFDKGIGLRQLIDYYYVLKNLPKERHSEVLKWVKAMGLKPLSTAVMWIMCQILGLNEEYLYVTPNEKRGRRLLKEIEICGNFGHYDERMGHAQGNFVYRNIRKTTRNLLLVFDYPVDALSEPVFRILHWMWRQYYQTKWILFGKKK